MKSNKGKNIIMALVASAVVFGIAFVAFSILPKGSTISRIFQILGGDLPGGIIQFLTYVAFFLGIFEINERLHRVKYESQGFDLKLLPEQEQWVLSPDDVNELKIKTIKAEENGSRFLLTDVIKKACTKFRSNKSVSDVLDIVSTQIKINMTKAESKQSIIRYLAWAIPSIGFIGTIIGIAKALGYADRASDPEGIAIVTNYMYIAFDTTLVALILSIVLMWFYYNLQEKEEDLHNNMEEYVMENLVNRIHME